MIEIKPLIIAHRGASFYRPENTFASFQLAYEQGADGIETDIHLSKDNVPVLIHDETINRVTNQESLINQLTYHELSRLDIGSWFSPLYKNERIMSLADFLQWAKAKQLTLNLELKTNKVKYVGIEALVYQQVLDLNMLDRVIFSSFNLTCLEKLAQLNPETTRAFLAKRHTARVFKLSQQQNLTGVHLKRRFINRMTMKRYHQINKYVGAYTVNHPTEMRQLFRAKCDMIITDRPDLAIEKRELFLNQIRDSF